MLFNIPLDEGRLASILCPQKSPELCPLYKVGVQFFCVHNYLNPSQKTDLALMIRGLSISALELRRCLLPHILQLGQNSQLIPLGLRVGVDFLNHFLKFVVTHFNWNAYINQQVKYCDKFQGFILQVSSSNVF